MNEASHWNLQSFDGDWSRTCFDKTIGTNFTALAQREEDADTLFFDRRLTMEGDTELGLLVKNTLDAVDWPGLAKRLLPALPGRSQPA